MRPGVTEGYRLQSSVFGNLINVILSRSHILHIIMDLTQNLRERFDFSPNFLNKSVIFTRNFYGLLWSFIISIPIKDISFKPFINWLCSQIVFPIYNPYTCSNVGIVTFNGSSHIVLWIDINHDWNRKQERFKWIACFPQNITYTVSCWRFAEKSFMEGYQIIVLQWMY